MSSQARLTQYDIDQLAKQNGWSVTYTWRHSRHGTETIALVFGDQPFARIGVNDCCYELVGQYRCLAPNNGCGPIDRPEADSW